MKHTHFPCECIDMNNHTQDYEPVVLTIKGSIAEDRNNPFYDEDVYRTTKYRWFILMQLSFAIIASALIMMSFAPVSKIISRIYKVGDLMVNTCVMSYLIGFVLLNFISVSVLEKFGLSKPVSHI